jgi:hypothetical protein
MVTSVSVLSRRAEAGNISLPSQGRRQKSQSDAASECVVSNTKSLTAYFIHLYVYCIIYRCAAVAGASWLVRAATSLENTHTHTATQATLDTVRRMRRGGSRATQCAHSMPERQCMAGVGTTLHPMYPKNAKWHLGAHPNMIHTICNNHSISQHGNEHEYHDGAEGAAELECFERHFNVITVWRSRPLVLIRRWRLIGLTCSRIQGNSSSCRHWKRHALPGVERRRTAQPAEGEATPSTSCTPTRIA